jgi:hypothetical protein
MPAFDIGSWYVPNSGPAVVHQGEMILPAALADAVRGGSGGSTINLHVHAIDAMSVRKFFENNGEHNASALHRQFRNGHPATQGF